MPGDIRNVSMEASSKAKVLERGELYAALDAILPLYPHGIPQRMLGEVRAQVALSEKALSADTVWQGDGSSGLALFGHWPCNSGDPFASAEGQLLRAAVEKGLQVSPESVLVLSSPLACAPFATAAVGPLGADGSSEGLLRSLRENPIRALGLLGARGKLDVVDGSSQGTLPEWLRLILAPDALIVPMVSLSDIVGVNGSVPNDSAKRELWTDLKRLKTKLRGAE